MKIHDEKVFILRYVIKKTWFINNIIGLKRRSDSKNYDAVGDVLLTTLLFLKLISELKKRGLGLLGNWFEDSN